MHRFARFSLIALFLLAVLLLPPRSLRAATTRLVSTTGSDSGDCSVVACATIAYAISQAIAGDTVAVAAGTYTEFGIDINKNLTITGAGATSTIVQAAASAGIATDRVFRVSTSVTAVIQDMTVRYGNSASGGGINNVSGFLTLNNVLLSDNRATTLRGGGLSTNGGSVTLNNTLVTGNQTLTNNREGGGIYSNATMLTLNNSTVSGNTAVGDGGGIYLFSATADINYSTIVSNTSNSDNDVTGDGGGLYNNNTTNLNSSIVAGNKTGTLSPVDSDCAGTTITSQNYNLTGDSTGCSLGGADDLIVDASSVFTDVLGPLANNGGPTYSHALLAGSFARDRVPNGTNQCGSAPFDKDQRGNPRPIDAMCDVGAYEADDVTAPTVTSFAATSPATSLNVPITAFTAGDATGVTGYLITESSTPPASGAAGWTASAPISFTVAGTGNHTLYPWAKDAAGNVSVVYGSPASVAVCFSGPLTVTSNANGGAGTLRQAIADACAGATIVFDSALSGSTIHLTSTLTLVRDVTIDGSALASQLTLSGDGDNNGTGDVRVLHVVDDPLLDVALNSLTLTKGQSNEAGAILNEAYLTITNSNFLNNSSTGYAGAISSQRPLTIINSTFSGNSSTGSSTGGGAILNSSTLTIIGSTFISNTAHSGNGTGGALYLTALTTIVNSTFSGNSAAVGGGILTTSALTIKNSTLSGNSAIIAGGLDVESTTTTLSNTIIANSPSGGDCVNNGSIGVNANNLIEDGSCSAALSGDPKLSALANHGGSTQTFALLPGSPAINAGNDTTCTTSPVNDLDQRGFTRTSNGPHCDIGAYEYQDAVAPTVNSFSVISPSTSLNVPVTAFTASDNLTVTGYLITQSATPPSPGAAGWTSSVPATHSVGGDGTYSLYPWVKDAAGNVSAVYGSPAGVNVDATAPTAGSLVAPNVTLDGGTTYSFTVTFSDNQAINVTSLNGSDVRVTGPGGFNQLAAFVGVTPAGSGTPRTAVYQITPPGGTWDQLDSGAYTIAVQANQVFDSVDNPVAATTLGSFQVNLNHIVYLPLALR